MSAIAALAEGVEVLLHDLDGEGIGGGIGAQLEEETLGHGARGHPGGIEALDQGEHLLDVRRLDPAPAGDLVHVRRAGSRPRRGCR